MKEKKKFSLAKTSYISYNTFESEEKRVVIMYLFYREIRVGGTYQKDVMNLLLDASRRLLLYQNKEKKRMVPSIMTPCVLSFFV